MSVQADHSRRLGSFIVAALVIGAALSACSTSTKTTLPADIHSEAERRAEAIRYVGKAQEATKKGDNDEALEFYRQAIQLTDSLDTAWNNLGVLLLEEKNYQAAIFAFGRAADLNPSDPRPMTNIGIAYSRAGHSEKALRAFEDALLRDPNWLDALRGAGKATMLLRIADDKALARTMHALLIEPDDEWRAIFEREKFRIQRMIDSRER